MYIYFCFSVVRSNQISLFSNKAALFNWYNHYIFLFVSSIVVIRYIFNFTEKNHPKFSFEQFRVFFFTFFYDNLQIEFGYGCNIAIISTCIHQLYWFLCVHSFLVTHCVSFDSFKFQLYRKNGEENYANGSNKRKENKKINAPNFTWITLSLSIHINIYMRC